MSEFSDRVLELTKELQNRKNTLESKIFKLRNQVQTIDMELKYVEERLNALKPLQDLVYAEEYLDSIKDNSSNQKVINDEED